ncbi:MAG: CCA tRNA nucleotidyltransferase [Eubacteriales bacterium]|nr:CCA tRNA nucleotidyltransferase [Eubacteriales bacterium]
MEQHQKRGGDGEGRKPVIVLPEPVRQILSVLHGAGYEAYVVGGCVRDSLLGREPEDWDITTSAKPEQTKALFRRTIDTGIQHGTVTVMLGGKGYEITTYRIDGAYEDGRHPKQVSFTASLSEDLRRRDFTINAMAYSEEEGVIDLFCGMEDLEAGVIRAVGDPAERFTEDALRIMRAVRFSAQLGYEIEEETKRAISKIAPNLRKVSAERIQVELTKLLCSAHPDDLRIAWETGMTGIFLPEFDACMETPQHNPHHRYSVGEHILHSLPEVRPDKVLRLAMLLHDIGKPLCRTTDADGTDHFHGHAEKSAGMAEQILRRLKYDNDTIRRVERLVRYHGLTIEETPAGMRRAIVEVGEELFPLLFEVKYADGAAQSEYRLPEKKELLARWRELYDGVMERGDCLNLKQLAVSGKDLIVAGMKPGEQLGQTLQAMLRDVLERPQDNTREYLMEHFGPQAGCGGEEQDGTEDRG